MVMPREERPPYVTFEVRAVEDRNKSIAAGHWVGMDTDFVMITPQGSKDRIERDVKGWFAMLEQMVREQRFPQRWLSAYREIYQAWKKGEEVSLDGTPLRSWPPLSPSQYKLLKEIRLYTVEDLAQANEETIGRIGPGARSLVSTAQEWLKQARDVGKPVMELEMLRQDAATLRATNEALQSERDDLAGRLKQVLQNTSTVVDGAAQRQVSAGEGMDLDMSEVLADGAAHSP